jgi:hypothetical protein
MNMPMPHITKPRARIRAPSPHFTLWVPGLIASALSLIFLAAYAIWS